MNIEETFIHFDSMSGGVETSRLSIVQVIIDLTLNLLFISDVSVFNNNVTLGSIRKLKLVIFFFFYFYIVRFCRITIIIIIVVFFPSDFERSREKSEA